MLDLFLSIVLKITDGTTTESTIRPCITPTMFVLTPVVVKTPPPARIAPKRRALGISILGFRFATNAANKPVQPYPDENPSETL